MLRQCRSADRHVPLDTQKVSTNGADLCRFAAVSNVYSIVVLLHEALSSTDSPFAKLVRHAGLATSRDDPAEPSTGVERPEYQPYRKLSAADLKELTKLYEVGETMQNLAQKFECHRQTIARQLKKAGVTIRPYQIRTPDFDLRARALYERGHSLDDVADMLGVQASTINRAVRGAGGLLRPPLRPHSPNRETVQ